MPFVTTSSLSHRIARARRALSEMSDAQTRLLELRTGVPMRRPEAPAQPGSEQLQELELLYQHVPSAPHH